MKALSFGEILFDVYPDEAHIGGAPLNFAAHLAKLGENVFMLSAIGRDDLGEKAMERLDEWNIDTRYLSKNDKDTGKCLVTLDEKGVPKYNLLGEVAYDFIDTKEVAENFDVLYFGTLSLRGEYNKKSLSSLIERQKFDDIFVDVNIRAPFYLADTVDFALRHATVLKVSLEELETVGKLVSLDFSSARSFARSVAEKFPNIRLVVITLGADGAYAFEKATGKSAFSPAVEAKVVSTVGAGDSFSAAFLHSYKKGDSLKAALDFASEIAAKVVSKKEAVPDEL